MHLWTNLSICLEIIDAHHTIEIAIFKHNQVDILKITNWLSPYASISLFLSFSEILCVFFLIKYPAVKNTSHRFQITCDTIGMICNYCVHIQYTYVYVCEFVSQWIYLKIICCTAWTHKKKAASMYWLNVAFNLWMTYNFYWNIFFLFM